MLRWFRVCVVCAALGLPATMGGADLIGDPGSGAKLFQDLRCATCHTVRGSGGKMAPELGEKMGVHDTPNGIAAAMWSHATKMWEAIAAAGVARPMMTEQQAADIIAYISLGMAQDKPGDAMRGQKVYEAKYCASCHDVYSGAPQFTSMGGRASAYWMVAGMWEHGAGMLSRLTARNTAWQTLSSEEVSDILAYLNSRK